MQETDDSRRQQRGEAPATLPDQQVPEEDGAIDIRALLGTLWRRKWLIVFAVLMGVGLSAMYAQRLVERYTATAEVMLNTRETNVVDVEAVVSGLTPGRDAIESEIAILTSNRLLRRVAEKLRLDRDPEFGAAIAGAGTDGGEAEAGGGVGGLISSAQASIRDALPEKVRLAIGLEELEMPADPVRSAEEAQLAIVNGLRDAISVRQRGASLVMQVSVVSTDSRKAALIANTVAEQYLIDQLEAKFEATQRATGWLNERVAALREKVERAEAAVEAYKAEHGLGDSASEGGAILSQQIGELNSKLVSARAARAEAEARFGQVRRRLEEGGIAAVQDYVSSEMISRLRERRSQLAQEEAELSTRYGPRYPAMIKIRAEIEDVDSAIRAEVRKIVDGLRNDVEVARARETTLEQSLDELERKASSQSRQSVELRQLERDAEASRLVYQNFLSRFKETSEQEDLQEPDARIISEAEPPLSPSEPNRQRVVLLGGAFGLMLGLGLVFLLEQLSNTFRTAADLEEQGGLPVLARIPRVWRRMRRSKVIDYARRKPNSALAEGIRNLRTAVFLANLDHPPKAVMITSSFPGEGKSTTALLLAWMSNQIGKSAIIVDCDVRRPTLYKTLGLEDVPDILSVLDGSVPLDEAIRTDEAYGLHVLPAIRTVPHAPDVLSSRRFGELIDELRARYDFVLLDAPPILSVSDAGVVGKVADATVYMVRWDATPRRAVLDGVKRLQDLRIRVTGTAMTLVDRKREAQYESYHYGYGYYAKRDAYYAD